jgi:catechol 2,3-dioxygenase-like lactoylglutathione lyase family enzyme
VNLSMDASEFRFAFHALDFERSVHFYRDILGMAYLGGWDRPDGKGALLAAGGNAVVEIYGAAEGEPYTGPSPAAINLSIRLVDAVAVDTFFLYLRERQAGLQGLPEDHPWGHRSFVVIDPDGIPIHYYCDLV